jgi:hypothetical protein
MNQFSDLQATDLVLNLELQLSSISADSVLVLINQQVWYQGSACPNLVLHHQLGLLEPFTVTVHSVTVAVDQLLIDQWPLLPEWSYLLQRSHSEWQLQVDRPFYQWRHRITNQGMLLTLHQ